MNTIQLGYFLALARTLNYTAASEQLFVSQPTLSRNIISLETELDTKLFYRTGSGVRLTAAGETLYQDIQPLMAQYDTLVRRVQNLGKGLAGELTVAVSSEQQMPQPLTDAIRAFGEAFPNVTFRFRLCNTTALRDGLLNGTIDLAVELGVAANEDPAISELLLAEEPAQLVTASHLEYPAIITARLCASLLDGRTLIFPSPLPADDIELQPLRALRQMLRAPEMRPNIRFIEDTSAMGLYVAAGQGMTICNRSHNLELHPGVVMREVTGAEPYRKVLHYQTNSKNPVIKNFLSFLSSFLEGDASR